MIAHKEYLGDSVYADFDGFMVILTTENGDGEPGNTIALEPEVITALNNYAERIKGHAMQIKMQIERGGKPVEVNVMIDPVKGKISRFAFTLELDHAYPLTDEECGFAENLYLEKLERKP